jgi:hypothetical protein
MEVQAAKEVQVALVLLLGPVAKMVQGALVVQMDKVVQMEDLQTLMI